MRAKTRPAGTAAPAATARLGAAVVGLGVGSAHARAYAASRRSRLVWAFDRDQAKAERLCRELGVPAAASYEQVLEDPEVQVVSIASFDQDHAAQAAAALKAGKHVFVEKPLARSWQELESVRRAWEGSGGRHLASNLVLRAAPLYQWLKGQASAGALGELYALDGDYLFGRLSKITEGWRKDVEGYSVMQGGGVHLLDLMMDLAGERPLAVWAAGNRLSTKGTAFRYDDFVAATFRFPSGLLGRLTANFGCVHRHQHVLRLFGTKATFLHDDQGPRLYKSREPGQAPESLSLAPEPASKGALIEGFLAAIAAGADSKAQARREFDLIAACLAADRAASLGQTVAVEYPL